LENIYVYRIFDEDIYPIFETKLDLNLQEQLKNCSLSNLDTKSDSKHIMVRVYDFVIILEGDKLKSDYIINNALIHSI
jgi:hypothetical protein